MKSKELENKIGIVARTHVGMVRQNNEDYYGYMEDITRDKWRFHGESIVNPDQPILLVVADGMGGMEMGEEASRIAVEVAYKYVKQKANYLISANEKELIHYFNELFADANESILKFAKKENKAGDIGTTLIIAFIFNKTAHIFWIGDSRCYLYRNGKLTPISKDHSYVQELVDQGKITYEQAFYHPESNIITKFMGDPKTTPIPSHTMITMQDGDVLLLCSDGLNSMLEDHVIEQHFSQYDDLTELCESLIKSANEAGGHDNTTIILASFGDFVKYRPFYIKPEKNLETSDTKIIIQKEYINVNQLNWKKAIIFFILGCLLGITGMLSYYKFLMPNKSKQEIHSENNDTNSINRINNKATMDNQINKTDNIKSNRIDSDDKKNKSEKVTEQIQNNEEQNKSGKEQIKLDNFPEISKVLDEIIQTYSKNNFPGNDNIVNNAKNIKSIGEKGFKNLNELKNMLNNLKESLIPIHDSIIKTFRNKVDNLIENPK